MDRYDGLVQTLSTAATQTREMLSTIAKQTRNVVSRKLIALGKAAAPTTDAEVLIERPSGALRHM